MKYYNLSVLKYHWLKYLKMYAEKVNSYNNLKKRYNDLF